MAFPSSPVNGQIATVANVIYTYNSTKTAWIKTRTGGTFLSVNTIAVTGANTSTSTTTGAMIVTGGLGVGGNLNVGGTLVAGSINNIVIGNTNPSSATFSTVIADTLTTNGNANVAGSIRLSGFNPKILADFSNATIASGASIQTSIANGNSNVYVIPNGTGTVASFQAANSSSPDTSSKVVVSINSNVDARIASAINGIGVYLPLTFYTSGAEQVRVHTNGNVSILNNLSITRSLGVGTAVAGNVGEIRATNYITAFYSDKRLKSNIQVIDNALDRVEMLTGIFYTQNQLAEQFGYNDYSQQVGLFAQDLQVALPPVVKPAPFDINEAGSSISGQNYLTVQYEKIIPLLVEAIKELRQEVNQLKGI